MRRSLAFVLAPFVLLSWGASGARPAEEVWGGVQPGDRPSHRFRTEIVGGPGIIDLAELRGRPVLVDFWGTRCSSCVELSVPGALDLAAAYPGELTVLLVESQSAGAEEMELFAYQRRWMETPALWTTEAPFRPGSRGLPSFVLLAADGEVVLTGNSVAMKQELEDAVAEEIELARRGPDGVSRAVRTMYADFAAGRYAQAVNAARKAAASGKDDDALLAVETFDQRLDQLATRAEWLLSTGYYVEAEAVLQDLGKGLHGLPEREQRVRELVGQLGCPELEAEVEAARVLARIETKARSKGLEPAIVKDLERFVERHPAAKCTARAQRLLELVRS